MTHEAWRHTVLAALTELGVFKPGEEVRILHQHACNAIRGGPCVCPGGPEFLFADWDERSAVRYQPTPERFYVRH